MQETEIERHKNKKGRNRTFSSVNDLIVHVEAAKKSMKVIPITYRQVQQC